MVGNVPVGSKHPVARQTMTTTDTRDVDATVAQARTCHDAGPGCMCSLGESDVSTCVRRPQVIKCADEGAEIVRITVQGMQEAKAAEQIKNTLVRKGYNTPLVADIHFAPKVAMLVADSFDKIRINPGNFVDGRKSFETINYEDEKQYQAEVDYIEEACQPPSQPPVPTRTNLAPSACAHGAHCPTCRLPLTNEVCAASPLPGLHAAGGEVQEAGQGHARRHQPRQPGSAVLPRAPPHAAHVAPAPAHSPKFAIALPGAEQQRKSTPAVRHACCACSTFWSSRAGPSACPRTLPLLDPR